MSFFRYSYFARTLLPGIVCAGLAGLFGTGIASAQASSWNTPSSGYVYDPAQRSIRSITGFIGAAVLGPAVADGIDWVSVSPNQKSALAERNGSLIWIPDLSSPNSSQNLDRIPLPSQSLWASDSSQAVILTADAQLIWLTSFRSNLVALSTWTLSSYSHALSNTDQNIGSRRRATEWTLLATDSSASQVVLGLRVGDAWQLWVASSTVPPQAVPFSGLPVAAAFGPGPDSIVVADGAGHRIVRIQNPATVPVGGTLLSSDAYLGDPAAIAFSSDGSRIFIADRTDSTIREFDLHGASAGSSTPVAPIAEMPSGVPPVSLTLYGQDRFLINAPSVSGRRTRESAGQAFFFLDTGTVPRVSFVPGEN